MSFVDPYTYLICLLLMLAICPPGECIDDVAVDLVQHYFSLGYTYKEIIGALLLSHHIILSLRHLKRLFRRLGLRRVGNEVSAMDIIREIKNIRGEGGIGFGYRAIHRIINLRGFRVTQRTVMHAMRLIDPDGTDLRRQRRLLRREYINRGPNYLVHIDGHDKLKPFGISVHGAIDGFSRRIIWLKAGFTNNDPKYIARFYMEEVLRNMRLPRCIRSDKGTENSLLSGIHSALRSFNNDSQTSVPPFMSGPSTANQRIEMFWGLLTRAVIDFWKNLFKDMRDSGLFEPSNPLHVECLRFCFMAIIQRQLDGFTEYWNLHRIRSQRNMDSPAGIPDVLYFQPEMYGARDFSFPVPITRDGVAHIMNTVTLSYPEFGCCEEFVELVTILSSFRRDELEQPRSVSQGLRMFEAIINKIH